MKNKKPYSSLTEDELREYNRIKAREYYRRNRLKVLHRQRMKRIQDEDFRERQNAYSRQWREDHPGYFQEWLKRQDNAEHFRVMCNEYQRTRYRLKRIIELKENAQLQAAR